MLPKLLVARALVCGLLGLLVVKAIVRRRLVVKRTSLELPLVAFLASAVLSTVLAYNPNVALLGTYTRYDGLLTTLTYFALFWLALQTLDGPGSARSLMRVLVASAYVVALLAVVQSVHDSALAGAFKPAFGTLGNQNVTGSFLAMVCPLAFMELATARSWGARLLGLNALVLIGAALLLTLSRSSWLGVGAAALVLAAMGRGRFERFGLAAGLAAVGAVVLMIGVGTGRVAVEQRLISALYPPAWGPRIHIWQDSVSLISSRPLAGYGPDNFGLVYPRFQTGKWAVDATGFELQIDKAHAELLQVAATQGLIGLAACLLVLIAYVRAFWRGRRSELAVALFAAWTGYEVTLQLNFTALGSAFPFWITAAAAVEVWEADARPLVLKLPAAPRLRVVAVALTAAALAALAAVAVVLPYVADLELLRSVQADFAGRRADAATPAATASALAPFESVYAVEVGNLAFERGDWAGAASAYSTAARLGTYNPRVYRNLALAERNLGRFAAALAAARQAAALDRFDPANQALVDQLDAQNS